MTILSNFVDLTDLSFFLVVYFTRVNLQGASLGASLSGAPLYNLCLYQHGGGRFQEVRTSADCENLVSQEVS